MFLDHTQRRSTVGRTPLDELSARRRDLYLTTHDTHNRQIFMPPVGFEPTISVGERLAAAHLLLYQVALVGIHRKGRKSCAVRWEVLIRQPDEGTGLFGGSQRERIILK
jgi:hypothetical protein